jgi:hypothetical protein
MNIESNLSGHWTDEQMIQYLYGIGPEEHHIEACACCRDRLADMVAARRIVDSEASWQEQVPFDVLAAQRRSIYSQIAQSPSWRLNLPVRRWAAGAAMVLLLGSGVAMYEHSQQHQIAQNQSKLSDAQLAQEVSQVAQNSEPSPTAPLEGLFDE